MERSPNRVRSVPAKGKWTLSRTGYAGARFGGSRISSYFMSPMSGEDLLSVTRNRRVWSVECGGHQIVLCFVFSQRFGSRAMPVAAACCKMFSYLMIWWVLKFVRGVMVFWFSESAFFCPMFAVDLLLQFVRTLPEHWPNSACCEPWPGCGSI